MHAQYTLLMSLVLDHRATEAERRQLQSHLAACPACAVTWEQLRWLDRRLEASPLLDAPAGFADRVMARLAQSGERNWRWPWLGSGLVLAWVTALVVLSLLSAVAVWWGINYPLEVSVVLSAFARLASVVSLGLRAMGSVVATVGTGTLALAWGLLIGVTGCLGLLWAWLVLRSHPLVRSGTTARS